MRTIRIFLFLCIALILAFSNTAYTKTGSAKLSVDVPAGQWKSLQLKNLPKGAAVKAEIRSDGAVTVNFVDQSNYEKYPDIKRPLFQGNVRDKLSFSVKIPVSGHYYLVFDNASGKQEAKVDLDVYGASGTDSETVDSEDSILNNENKAGGKTLDNIEADLGRLFIFKTFPISVKACGKEEAYAEADGIIICTEFARKVQSIADNKDKSTNILLFTVFHEAGHILLFQWGYPFYDNEDIADEFSTILFSMLGYKDRLGAVTEFFISNPSSDELMAKALKGDRHQLSIQRARNIVRWQKDMERTKRWQNILIPHMQTNVLRKLKDSPPSWIESAVIEKELSARGH